VDQKNCLKSDYLSSPTMAGMGKIFTC